MKIFIRKRHFNAVLFIFLSLIIISISVQIPITGEPSKADDFKTASIKDILTVNEIVLDNTRKKAMSQDELIWEEKLEENLGDFYLPIYKRDKLSSKRTSWDYIFDNPGLPNVLIIGDSISRGYTIPIQDLFKTTADIYRVPENAGSTINALKKLDLYLSTAKHFDVIVFNFGIHDRRCNQYKYQENLEKIVDKLASTGAKLIFVNTTPFANQFKTIIPRSLSEIKSWYTYGHGKFLFFGDFMDENQLNLIANNVMSRYKIDVVDIENELGDSIFTNQNKHDVHFPEKYYAEIAKPVAKAISNALNKIHTAN
ncbi:SGNH/GDSL hydrolase family protein [Methylomonas methanica]|uniref:SGNH hydrolase-type esterase domain-containing protein n=1 Tax=Methylomonas methanica (strain DSM 25384 / MC09) TaxID=857087 RepID=F9ZWX6_METMM|nr:SGNH/GDSL hydrolase family protein [Methylomonas methanica]AEG02138.1 hypothetical protein Metme_3781 [Methylomonas methanica MC09]